MSKARVTITVILHMLAVVALAQQDASDENSSPELPVVAVTTLNHLSAYPDDAWVAMSFSESMASKLAQLSERMTVVERVRLNDLLRARGIARDSLDEMTVEEHQEIGSYIGCQRLILGSVSLTGSGDDLGTRITANVRTVDVETGEIMNANSVQGEVRELFDLETELALALLRSMGIDPSAAEIEQLSLKETTSLVADKYFNLGQQSLYQGDYERAKSLYDKALETLSGAYYQAAELSLIEALRRQKDVADDAQKTAIRAEARRRRDESRRIREQEFNARLFTEAQYSLVAEDYESALALFEEYQEKARPPSLLNWQIEIKNDWINRAYDVFLYGGMMFIPVWSLSPEGYVFRVTAIDNRLGSTRWTYITDPVQREFEEDSTFGAGPGQQVRPFGGSGGTIVISVDNHRIAALDIGTGDELWTHRHDAQSPWSTDTWPTMSVSAGRCSVKFDDGIVKVFDLASGSALWKTDSGLLGTGGFAADEELVYVASRDQLLALESDSGEERWRRPLGGVMSLKAPWCDLLPVELESIKKQGSDYERRVNHARDVLSDRELNLAEAALDSFRDEEEMATRGLLVFGNSTNKQIVTYDVLQSIDGAPLRSTKEFVQLATAEQPTATRSVEILRARQVKRIEIAESLDPPGLAVFHPVLLANRDAVFVGVAGSPGSVCALEKPDGGVRWHYDFPMEGSVVRMEVVDDRFVVTYLLPYYDSRTYVLGLHDGQILAHADANAVVTQDSICSQDWIARSLESRSIESNELLWSDMRKTLIVPTAQPRDVGMFFTFEQPQPDNQDNPGILAARSGRTGEELWRHSSPGGIAELLLDDDHAYVVVEGLYGARSVHSLRSSYVVLPGQVPARDVLAGIGSALVGLGRNEDAIAVLSDARAQGADLRQIDWLLMRAYAARGDMAQAIEARHQFLVNSPYESTPSSIRRQLHDEQALSYWSSTDARSLDELLPAVRTEDAWARPNGPWGSFPLTFIGDSLYMREGSDLMAEHGWWKDESSDPRALGEAFVSFYGYRTDGAFPPRGEPVYVAFYDRAAVNERSAPSLGAFDRASHKAIWLFKGEPATPTPLGIGLPELEIRDEVYWGAGGVLYVIDKTTGNLIWRFSDPETPHLFKRGAVVSDDGDSWRLPEFLTTLYIDVEDVLIIDSDVLISVSKETGELNWRVPFESLHHQVLLRDGLIYALSGGLYWSYPEDGRRAPIRAPGALTALDRETGAVLRRVPLPYHFREPISEFAVDDDMLYVHVDYYLLAFDQKSDNPVWSFDGSHRWSIGDDGYSMAVGDRSIYLPGRPLYAIDKQTGQIQWALDGFEGSVRIAPPGSTAFGQSVGDPAVLYAQRKSGIEGYKPAEVVYGFDVERLQSLGPTGKLWWTPYPTHRTHRGKPPQVFLKNARSGLARSGFPAETLSDPVVAGMFRAPSAPSVSVVFKQTAADIAVGWYQGGEDHQLFESVADASSAIEFHPNDGSFGFYIRVRYQGREHIWRSETDANNGEIHLIAFPIRLEDSNAVDSYILCWEDLPLDSTVLDLFGDLGFYDDVVIRVDGIVPEEAAPYSGSLPSAAHE
ncbi:MAG: PQQ-binding-like beta-propeller repeat protein [Candidatus Poribacteria bacterium]|nr:PQQ-binding-like beta-propeller repeat protein [Candidatus Poribacteria bacterium]